MLSHSRTTFKVDAPPRPSVIRTSGADDPAVLFGIFVASLKSGDFARAKRARGLLLRAGYSVLPVSQRRGGHEQ